jgi:hypothetical protein
MGLSVRRGRGIAPIIMGIAAIIFGVLATALAFAAPGIAEFLLNQFGGEGSVYLFLIEIPTADVNNPETMTAPITGVFDLLRNVALVFFAVALVVAGLYYSLESFRLVSEGTAASIVTGSIFTAFMIYLFLPIYNVTASLLNTLTSPDQELILSPGMIKEILAWAMYPQTGNITDQMLAFFLSVFFLVMVVVTLISVAILGILRIFFLAAIAAMMPILLVLRLIPLTRRMADSFIDMLIGLMLSSLVAAIFLRFGYEVLHSGSFTGLAGTVVAWATLIAAAMMPTVLAPRLSGLFMTTAGMVTAAASTATIGTVGTLSGVAIGATKGIGAIGHATQAGLKLSKGAKLETFLSSVGHAAGPFVTGTLTRRFEGALPTIGGIPSLGGVYAAVSQSRAGLSSYIDRFMEERAGTATEVIMTALPFASSSPLASEADGRAWQDKIRAMSDEEAGNFFLQHFPRIKLLEKYRGSVGKEFKKTIAAASPLLASNMVGNLKKYEEDEKAREAFIRGAFENFSKYKDRLKAKGLPVPDVVDKADATPTFMRDIFRYGGETAKVVNGKLLYSVKIDYDPNMPLEEARKAADKFANEILIDPTKKGARLAPEEVAEKLAGLVGIKNLSSEEKARYGHVAIQTVKTLRREAPRVLAAITGKVNSAEWEKRMKSRGFAEKALGAVDSGELSNWLAGQALEHLRERGAKKAARTAAEMKERERQIRHAVRTIFAPPVSLKTLFPEEPKPPTETQPPKVNLGDFFRSIDRELLRRKGSAYTPPKPKKRGVKVAEGFGISWQRSLEKYMKKKKHQEEEES